MISSTAVKKTRLSVPWSANKQEYHQTSVKKSQIVNDEGLDENGPASVTPFLESTVLAIGSKKNTSLSNAHKMRPKLTTRI